MSLFRFTLGSYTLLEDQPHGWDKLELNIKRDGVFNAMYITYTNDLIFWGEGWDFCKNIIDTQGICGIVDVLIEVDRDHNGQYKTLFSGIADFTDAKIDYERCEITLVVKDNIIMKLLSDRIAHDVGYNNAFRNGWENRTVGDDPIDININDDGSIVSTTNISAVTRGNIARAIDLHLTVTGGAAQYNGLRWGYKIIDALREHIAVMTDNQVSVESDFFTQNSYTNEHWLVSVDKTTMGAGDIYTIRYKNAYGQLIEPLAVNFTTNADTTLQLIADALLLHSELDRAISIYLNTAVDFASDTFSYSVIDTVSTPATITAQSFTPVTGFTITCNNSVVFTITKTQSITYGMANLFMAYNSELSGYFYGGKSVVSFEQLFKMLDSHFNLGMSLQSVGGNFILRIEPKSYFFNNPEIMDIGGVMNIKSSANKDMTIKNLTVGNIASDYYGFGTGKKQTWTVNQCETGDNDKSSEANFDIGSIGDQIPLSGVAQFTGPASRYQDAVTFIIIEPSDINYGLYGNMTNPSCSAAMYPVKVINSSLFSSAPSCTIYGYNAGLINYWAVYNHLFIIAGDPKTWITSSFFTYLRIIKNTDDAIFRMDYEFDGILTDAAIQAIFNQPIGSIGFSKDPSNHLSKGIYELKWSAISGAANFKLFG